MTSEVRQRQRTADPYGVNPELITLKKRGLDLAAVGLEVLMATVVHSPVLKNLIFPWYEDHAAAGETGGLQTWSWEQMATGGKKENK